MGIFTDEQTKLLEAKLDADAVSERQGLSYIESWHAIAEANRVFGFGMWSTRLIEMRHLGDTLDDKNGKTRYNTAYLALYEVSVQGVAAETLKAAGLSCVYQDVGFGNAFSYQNPLDNHEKASKEAASDSIKRCLRNLGNVFGLALYDKQQRNVAKNASSDDVLKLLRKLGKLGKAEEAKGVAQELLQTAGVAKLNEADADTVNAVYAALESLETA